MPSIEQIASSRVRLTIAALLSSRPRTLSELSEKTGISIQGVLKHLAKLQEEQMVNERRVGAGRFLKQRKVYSIEKRKVSDYSEGDLLVASLGRWEGKVHPSADPYRELDSLAQDALILRRRAREASRRMRRAIEEVADDEARMSALIDSLPFSEEEKQIAYLIFGEDTPDQTRATLRKHFACPDPDAAVESVTSKMRAMKR